MYKFNITDENKVWYARAVHGAREREMVNLCLDNFQLSPGKFTAQFEAEIATIFGKKHAVMVNSGSSALLLVAELLKIKPGDEIITGASGFPTTLNPFLLKGGTVVLVDVEPLTLAPKIKEIEKAITKKTKAIVVAHIWGMTLDLRKLRKIADKHGILLVEDSCDSIGAKIDGQPSGSYSDISVTSFFPSHVITAGGGGGMICVKTAEEEKTLRVFRDWGRSGTDSEDLDDRFGVDIDGIPYDAKFCYGVQGYNLKATELQAAFGLAQLESLVEWNKLRAKHYEQLCAIVGKYNLVPCQSEVKDLSSSYLAFPMLVPERRKLATYLEQNNIQTRPILAGNFMRHEAFKKANIRVVGTLEGADAIAKAGLGIGLHQALTQEHIDHVAKVLKEYK